MADQSFEYMNVMQTVGLCFDSDISAKKSVNPQTQTRQNSKDINNVDCMKIDYQDIMQIYLFHSTCSYYGKDIDSEPSCLEPVQINKVFTEDSIDIDDKQRTDKDNKLKASEGIIKVSPNAAAKVEFLSLLLMSWYPHLEITPANGVEAKKTPPIDHTKTEKHPPRNDTSMELDDLAGKPEIPDSQTDLGEPKIGKEYMWLTCPNEQLLELEFSKLFMCTIDGMESTSTVSEVVKNLEKESNHVIQDEGLLSDSSQIAIMQNNNGTTPWSTLSAYKCQGSECPENKAERRSVFHDKPRMSQTQSQYCSRPMYVDLLVPSGGLCEVQQKTSKQEVFYRSTALPCSKLKRYKDILLAYNQPKFCIIQDFSIAPKVPSETMSVNTSSRLDGYHHEFADAYMKKYYCFGSQSILPPEVDHHEDKSGSINTILVSKRLTLRWNQNTCSKIDGYFHTLNDTFRKEKQCLIDGDQVDVKSKEKSQKVCSKHSQSCLYVDLFMKIISFYKRICFMTDGHMLMHREFESILIEASLDSKPSIKTFKQPNETIEHKILHGHGSCRLDLFEDIVTFRSKQRFSRNGIIKEIEMCPLRKITLMEEVSVPSEATDESILHSEKHEQNVPVDLTGSTPEIRFSYSNNDSCFQGSKLDDYKALLSFMCTPLQFQSGQDKQLPEKEGNYFVEIETILCPINTCCPFSKVDGYKALFNLMCIPLYLKSAENSSEGKILKESEVHQSYTNPLLHCSKIDEYKTLFILMTDTPVQLQLSSDSHFPTNLGISLDVTRSALSSISCCQCPKMDEYKTLFEIKKHAPPDFQLTQATAFPPKERKDLIELKVSHSLPLQSDSDEQFPNDKGKGLEEIVVSYSPSNSYCLCSKIDEYKALFTPKTCAPLHSQSSSDEQLPTDRGKGLEEIEVFHSHRNSCHPYSKMDEYKALFEIMKHTPHDFQSTQSITFPPKEGKDLIELKVSRSPIKPRQYSKVDGYKALFNLAACDPLPLQWDSDEQFLNDKGKGLEEIVVSNSPTNSYCLSAKMDEYKAMFKLTVCDSLHLQPTPVAQSSTDKGKGFKVIGVFRSHNASCCQCYKLDEYKTLFDHTICSSAHIQSAKDSQYLTIKGKGSEEIDVSQSSTKSCSHLSKIDEYEAMFYPATCSSVPLQLAEGSQYLKVKENASEETEVSESPTKSCHHCSKMEEYKELFHPTTCSSADMQLDEGKEPEGTGNSEENVDDDDTQKENKEEIEEKIQDSETSQKNEEEVVIGEAVETDEVEDSERKHDIEEDIVKQNDEIQPDSIQPSPSFEVIDGTTIYLNDLEPTPLPGEPASEKYNTFNIHSSDIVDVPKKEDSDESDVGPPSSFSFKSEDEIDPEAYRNILNKLHANPELRDKEGAIQQEMLKILRDPELKKNLLIKAHEPKRDILSPFRSQHPAPGDAVHMDQAQGHADDNVDLQKLDAMQDESVPLDNADTAIPPLATGPNVVEGRPSSPLDKDEEDINFVDPLALLQEDTEEPPLSINEKIDIAEEILKTKDFSSVNLQPPVPPDDPYDPVKLAAKLNTVKGSNPAVFGDPAQEVFNDDPALSALEDQNDPVEQESQEPSLNDSHVTMPSDTEQVEDKVETIDDEEVPSPHLDSHLPPGVDTRPDVEELADSSYGEPGLRTSTRVDEEETPEDPEDLDHDHPLDEENAEDLEHSHPFDGDDVERPEDAQERPEDVQEIPDDVVLDAGVQDEDNSHEGEGFHHQIYTREENGGLQDDGVTIEEVPEHQEEQNGTGPGGDWFGEMLKNLEPAIEELNRSILMPMFEMLPIEFQRAIQQPNFLGIPWIFIIIFDVSMFTFFMLIFCCWVCSSRRSRSIQERLSREVDVLIAQKAEVMDALDMTNTQFQKQNLEYFELKTSTERTGSDKSKLETKYKEITHTSKEQQKEIEQMKATIKKKTSEHESSQQKIKSLEQQVKKSQKTISDLNGQVNDLQGKVYAGEEECSHLEHNIGTLEEQKQQLDTSKEMLEDEIKGWNERVSELSEQIKLITTEKKDMEESLTYKDNEIEVLKDCLLQLKGLEHIQKEGPEVDSESRIQQLMDVTRVNAKLSLIQKERDEIQQKLDDEVKCGRDLESKVGMLHHEIDALRMEHSKAQSNLGETKTKMEVLQEYFKGKEVELQRKLGREEALKLQSEEQLTSLSEKAINAEVDLNNYRQQIADLKSELEKSERNYKTQIAAHEKKTHEHWLSSRTAERELQEAKREAASLRHRLTELEGRRATSENAPLVKPQAAAPSPMRVVSPSYGPGDRGSKMSRRGPSRNSMIEADAPSPPLIDPRHRGSPGSRPRMSPPMMDRDMPPPHPDDYLPPPMHRDMGPSPYREVLPHHPDFGPPGPGPYDDPYGPPPPHGPPPHGGFSPEFGPHPDDMDFGPHGPPPGDFGPPMRFPPPGRGEFDPHGPPPPMPMGPDFDPMFGPPPPHGMDPMLGPGPFPRNGPPPFDRRGPPPAMRPSSRSGPGGAPDGPMGGPRTSSPMVTPDGQRGPRGPPPRQPSNMQA
nr:uncharacterized protein LOC129264571 isoform X2 [Lytechinus pictus]